MRCVVCCSETIEVREVVENIHHGTDIVRVTVSVPVCSRCGERYYDRKTVRALEDIRSRIEGGEVPLKEVGKVLVWGQ